MGPTALIDDEDVWPSVHLGVQTPDGPLRGWTLAPALTAAPPVWLSAEHDGSEGSPVRIRRGPATVTEEQAPQCPGRIAGMWGER